MKNYLLTYLFILLVFAASCSSEKDTNFYVKGTLDVTKAEDAEHIKLLLLKLNTINDFFGVSSSMVVDTAEIDEQGHFQFTNTGRIDDSLFYRVLLVRENEDGTIPLNITTFGIDENYTTLFLHKNSQIEFNVQADKLNYTFQPIQVDAINKEVRSVYNLQKEQNEQLSVAVAKLREIGKRQGAVEELDMAKAEIMGISSKAEQIARIYIDTVSNPYMLAYALHNFNFTQDSVYAVAISKRLNKGMPESAYTKSYDAFIDELFYTLAKGTEAPAFTLPDINDKNQSLADFRGKYVLIDFWASWCKPCREENKETVKPLYEKYKDKNFTVVSISLDEDKDAWLKAIKSDGLIWTNLSDLKGFGADVATLYRVSAVPTTYIIDPAGNIAGKNLRGELLQAFLAEKLGE